MPGRNLIRMFTEHGYYHVYNRGVNKRRIFMDEQDYLYFSGLFKRHLSPKPVQDRYGREYKWLRDKIEVLAFCWMPNHFHLFIYQKEDPRAIAELMMSVCTAYTMYFNRKYDRRGPLFESSYRASLISDDAYFSHISRYIHLNPKDYQNWQYSSLTQYLGESRQEWVNEEYIMGDFRSVEDYKNFVDDYKDAKDELDILKHELADH